MDLSVPEDTKISWLSTNVIRGQKDGPLLMLGPTRWKYVKYIKQNACKFKCVYTTPWYSSAYPSTLTHFFIAQVEIEVKIHANQICSLWVGIHASIIFSKTYINAVDQHIISAIFSRVVCAPVPINTPITRKWRGNALCTGAVCVAVKESEISRYKLGSLRLADRQLGRKMICKARISIHQ